MHFTRLGSRASSQRLDRSNDGQDHTVLPYASALVVHSQPRVHRDYPPTPRHRVPDAVASTAAHSTFVTTYDRPSDGMG